MTRTRYRIVCLGAFEGPVENLPPRTPVRCDHPTQRQAGAGEGRGGLEHPVGHHGDSVCYRGAAFVVAVEGDRAADEAAAAPNQPRYCNCPHSCNINITGLNEVFLSNQKTEHTHLPSRKIIPIARILSTSNSVSFNFITAGSRSHNLHDYFPN